MRRHGSIHNVNDSQPLIGQGRPPESGGRSIVTRRAAAGRTPESLSGAEYQAMQAKAMSEADLTQAVLDLCDMTGWTWRYHPYDSRRSTEGWFDFVFMNLHQKRVIFRELKGGRGKLTPQQAAVVAGFQECGLDAGVWTPEQWLDGTIERELQGVDATLAITSHASAALSGTPDP